MLKIESPMRFVREMKGAPLSVVMLLMLSGQGLSNGAICSGTGYSDKSIANALDYLEEVGLVVRSNGGWKMAEGQQLALPVNDDVQEPEENLDTNGESRKISVFDPLVNIVVNESNINDLTTKLSNTSVEDSEKFRENLDVMDQEGIKATEKTKAIARAEHVNALYILSHCEQVRREGQKVGLAIWRMEKGVERPLLRMENGHLEGCKCSQCGYVDYGQGVMSEEEEWEWWSNKG